MVGYVLGTGVFSGIGCGGTRLATSSCGVLSVDGNPTDGLLVTRGDSGLLDAALARRDKPMPAKPTCEEVSETGVCPSTDGLDVRMVPMLPLDTRRLVDEILACFKDAGRCDCAEAEAELSV